MKKLVLILSALLAVLVTVIACGAPPHAKPGGAAPHRLGVTLNDAGLPVDDSGAVSLVLDGGGVPAIFGDPPIDHCVINDISIDPPTCNLAAHVSCGPRTKLVQSQLSQAQCAAVFNLVRAAAATGGIQ